MRLGKRIQRGRAGRQLDCPTVVGEAADRGLAAAGIDLGVREPRHGRQGAEEAAKIVIHD